MSTFFLIIIALTPGIGIAVYIYFIDRLEPEPIKLVLFSFFLGIVSLGLDLLFAIPLDKFFTINEYDLEAEAVHAFIIVAFLEELSKFVFIRGILYKNKNFNEPLDGIVYSVMVGMGFATAENVIYAVNEGGGAVVIRMFSAIPAHALFAVLMGYMLGKAKFTHMISEALYALGALGIATLFHGVYDYFLFIAFVPGIWVGSVIAFIAAFFLSRKAVQLHQQASPFKLNKK